MEVAVAKSSLNEGIDGKLVCTNTQHYMNTIQVPTLVGTTDCIPHDKAVTSWPAREAPHTTVNWGCLKWQ